MDVQPPRRDDLQELRGNGMDVEDSLRRPSRTDHLGIPDLKWINRRLPIEEVVKKLELRFGERGLVHCWHPERHQNGDRTPSVSIRRQNNTIRCFGCGIKPMSVVDLVVDALGCTVAEAAGWLEQNFEVRRIPTRRRLAAAGVQRPYRVGMEQPIELLARSGLWAWLSVPARCIVPILLCFAEQLDRESFRVQISYRAVMRYSGLKSFSGVSRGLDELEEIGWLQRAGNGKRAGLLRETGVYILRPLSDAVVERANTLFLAEREIVQVERELREKQRRQRRKAMAERSALLSL